ncbi:hypothetical protein [Deinococcus radiodurans]|uniref:hypothetical protein n=1 Tax=Deinococcus radiodurans TaxID=1299 RepID=UPI003C7A34C3
MTDRPRPKKSSPKKSGPEKALAKESAAQGEAAKATRQATQQTEAAKKVGVAQPGAPAQSRKAARKSRQRVPKHAGDNAPKATRPAPTARIPFAPPCAAAARPNLPRW